MDRLIGIFLIVGADVSFASSPIFARVAHDAGVNPNTFLFSRFAIAITVLTIHNGFKGVQWPRIRLLVSLILIGGICFAGLNLSFHTALTLAPVNLVILFIAGTAEPFRVHHWKWWLNIRAIVENSSN